MNRFSKSVLSSFLGAALLTACAPMLTSKPGPTQVVSRKYSTMSYSLAGRPSAVLVGLAFDANGKVGICSTSATFNSGTGFKDQLVEQMRNRVVFRIDDDRILTGAQFGGSYQIDDTADILGKVAPCVVTDKPWKPGYAGKKVTMRANIHKIGS